MRVRCLSCGGEYDTLQADGSEYYHACPPLSVGELRAAVDAGKVKLPPDETVEDAHAQRTYVRASARDENMTRPADPTKPATVKAHGKGVEEIPPVAIGPADVVVDG